MASKRSDGPLPQVQEQYGSRSFARRYSCDSKGIRRVRSWSERARGSGARTKLLKFFKDAFLPRGYPESVSDDYLAYQMWDTVQAFCSSITGMLATMAILKGVGVGDSSATPLAATITWMLKDGAGMLGRILFAWVQGTDLDCNAKKWRFVADILNDIGAFLELLAPLFPHFFLLIVCAASISKSVVGVAGMATRAALVQHQARRDNMADVAAKDGSQETLVNLVALVVNFLITPAVAGKTELIWTLFFVFTFLHLLSNYRAVSVVKMETLNQNRLNILVNEYYSSGTILGPASVNAREPILTSPGRVISYRLGVPLSQVLTSVGEYENAIHLQQKGQHFLMRFQNSKRKVFVALHQDATINDHLLAALTVELLDFLTRNKDSAEKLSSIAAKRGAPCGTLFDLAQTFAKNDFSFLVSAFNQHGWETSHLLLGVDEWRYRWQGEEMATDY